MNEKAGFEKENRRFVNEKRRGQDPPDHLTDRLNFNPNTDLKQIAVLREIYQGKRPFYSLSQLESRFEASDKTVQNRLDEMTELGVLEKSEINNGSYWWIDWEESEYPIPPDVEVHEVRDEETISEFFSKVPVQLGAVALLATVVGGAVVWLGTFQSAGAVSLPFGASASLRIGLITQAVSYILLLTAIVVWIMEKATGEQLHKADLTAIFDHD